MYICPHDLANKNTMLLKCSSSMLLKYSVPLVSELHVLYKIIRDMELSKKYNFNYMCTYIK